MDRLQILNQVAIINEYLAGKPWLDIDVVECSPQSVVLECGIDLSVGPDIEIKFDSVALVLLLMTWKTDTALPVLQVLKGDDAVRFNQLYGIDGGYHLFSFQPENLGQDARCIVAAQSLSWRERGHRA